ncbi:Mitochondrial carrier [Venustampulla echinocandica]|uniref:Mitochondrial carrier n=1 Tax=Venustampulla echinocandica TaxID=2656787 RepID=A0A370U3M6_9HELO|nr:Mitochondrial carrier [Venustampulla echinocandica]RDL42380.1 Mitochondrial carrier [Venustampulla echinocandica]
MLSTPTYRVCVPSLTRPSPGPRPSSPHTPINILEAPLRRTLVPYAAGSKSDLGCKLVLFARTLSQRDGERNCQQVSLTAIQAHIKNTIPEPYFIMSDKDKQKPPIPPSVSLISGGIAGGVEAVTTYPFEFAKTRAQLRNVPGEKSPRNPFSVITKVYRHEGVRALYKGCGALAFGSVGKDAARFLSFDTVKNTFKDPETGALTPMRNMLAGMAAGVVASIFAVTPTERIKTALIDDARGARKYLSTMHAVRLIFHEDGFVGLYRGFVGTTLKQASATGFRMGSYNILKDIQEARHIKQNTAVNFINGSLAGIITTLCTQPFDTLKTRSQSAQVTTTTQAIKGILKDDGIRGFWRGTIMRLSRTVFSGGILFTTVEAVSKVITPVLSPTGRSETSLHL